MANTNKQYYGIKFPFTNNNFDGFFIDLNENIDDKVASEILHVILTPKRSRVRKPEFGTDLAKYIFEPNDSITWDAVRYEVVESVAKYVNNVKLDDIEVVFDEGEQNAIYLDIRYSVKVGKTTENKRMAVKL